MDGWTDSLLPINYVINSCIITLKQTINNQNAVAKFK